MIAVPGPSLTPPLKIAVREAWLAQRQKAILYPELAIIDPLPHLCDHPGERYLFHNLRQDIAISHDIRATFFIQCGAMLRTKGPDAGLSFGETEFDNDIAAMSASDG